MKRIAMLGILGILLVGFAWAQFQGYEWETMRDEIIAQEGEPMMSEVNFIAYPEGDNGWYRLFYFLEDGRLAKGRLYQSFRREDGGWQELQSLRGILTRKYGEPVRDEMRWFDSVSQSTRDYYSDGEWGTIAEAIDRGKGYWRIWYTTDDPQMEVNVRMTDVDAGVGIYIDYTRPDLYVILDEEEDAREEAAF